MRFRPSGVPTALSTAAPALSGRSSIVSYQRMVAGDLDAVGRVDVGEVGAEDVGVREDEVGDGFGVVRDDEAVGELLDSEFCGRQLRLNREIR